MTATAITNARVFDGAGLSEPTTVVLAGGRIGGDPSGARTVDAGGAVLLPGLIDAHVHLGGPDTLVALARHGVTTALDMASWPADRLTALREVTGAADFRSAGLPAIGPDGPHARLLGLPAEAVLTELEQVEPFLAARLAEGVDYLKIILEAPGAGGLPEPVAAELVRGAHAHGLRVVAHAASAGAYAMGVAVGADVLTHVPVGAPLPESTLAAVPVTVPTLTMMRATAGSFAGDAEAFPGALANVGALHRAGAPVLAGTDAHPPTGALPGLPHGASLHTELALLVAAGLSTVDALRAATRLPAQHFGLTDRGAVAPGLRADLVLVDGDPIADIRATANLLRVWCGGEEIDLAAAS